MRCQSKLTLNSLGLAFVLMGSFVLAIALDATNASANASKSRTTCQVKSTGGVDVARESKLRDLCLEMRSGAPFSEVEARVLLRFMSGESIAAVEADTVISRVLYAQYVTHQAISAEQEALIAAFKKLSIQRGEEMTDLDAGAAKVVIGVESEPSDLTAITAAAPSNDRICNTIAVPQPSGAPRSTSRQCYEIDTTGATAGPLNCDVVGGNISFLDTWYKVSAPHPCASMTVQVVAQNARQPAPMFRYTRGGTPFYFAEVPCGSACSNPFFDSPRTFDSSGRTTFTFTASNASRDLYFEVNAGGLQAVCFTFLCP